MQFLSLDAPQKTAIKIGETHISFAQLQHKIEATANQFKKLPKAILVLDASPNLDFIIQLLAALMIEQPIALFANQWCDEEKQTRLSILGTTIKVNNKNELIELHENRSILHHSKLSLLLFTSGSTGEVKAVQLSKINIEANCLAVIKALGFSKVQDQLLFLPLSYSFGLLGQLIPGLMTGITTELINQFTDIKSLLETGLVPEMWSGVPSHWVAISRMAALYPEHAAKITAIISAGASLPTALRHELSQTFPHALIYNNYGLTEASPRVLTYSSDDPLFMEDYAGYPIGDWQIMLSEDQELLIKGKQLMLGYLGEKENTKINQDWFATGDLAQILPSGLVTIKGRRDNQVNIAGEKVNLTEIEQKIGHIKGIQEVIVLPIIDEIYGIRLLACLERSTLPLSTTEQQLTEKIRIHLMPRKLPIDVQLIEKMPRNQHGKLDRKALTLILNKKDQM